MEQVPRHPPPGFAPSGRPSGCATAGQAAPQPPDAGLPGPGIFAAERGGFAPWCGPAVLALAAGRNYAGALALLRQVSPTLYPAGEDVVTVYWRDLLSALDLAGVPFAAEPPLAAEDGRRPTLLSLVRGGAMAPGWHLVRITGHFLLLRLHGFGLAQMHDNRYAGELLTAANGGRCRVSHRARILGGPLPG